MRYRELPSHSSCYRSMLPIIIFTKGRIFRYYAGFSFFIFIWISRLEKKPAQLIRHEKIHFYQQLELLFVGHWLLYGIFYLVSRYKGREHYIAYRRNPFEEEAYDNDLHEDYLFKRRPFAWVKYVPLLFSVREPSHPKQKKSA
jgi:hypothetical protein